MPRATQRADAGNGTEGALKLYYLVSFAFMGVYLPFFPTWLAARGITGIWMSGVTLLVPAMSVLGPPVFGMLADALGLRGWLLRVACAGAALAFLGVVALAWLEVPSYSLLLLAIAVFAFFRSPMAMMADVLALEHGRDGGSSYGRLRLWGSLGFLLAAVGFGRLADPTGAAVLPLCIAGALALALLTTFRLPARVPAPERPRAALVRELLGARDFQLLLVTAFLSQVSHSSYDLLVSLHFRDLGMSAGTIGVAWAIGVIAEIALMGWGQGLLDRWPPARLLALALAGSALRWVLLANLRSQALLLALQPLHALSFGLMWLSCLAFIQRRAPVHILATANASFVASIGIGNVVGMLIWGPLFRRSGGAVVYGAAALVAGGACLVALWFAARAARHERERPADRAAAA